MTDTEIDQLLQVVNRRQIDCILGHKNLIVSIQFNGGSLGMQIKESFEGIHCYGKIWRLLHRQTQHSQGPDPLSIRIELRKPAWVGGLLLACDGIMPAA